MPMLTEDERREMRAFIARRVPELAAELRSGGDREALARQAKGEWLLAMYAEHDKRIGQALLCEVIADVYGVRL